VKSLTLQQPLIEYFSTSKDSILWQGQFVNRLCHFQSAAPCIINKSFGRQNANKLANWGWP